MKTFIHDMSLHPNVEALLHAMRDLEGHLRDNGGKFWSAQVTRAVDVVAHSDAYGLERFLRLFGGMGSLNDLILHRDGAPLDAENDQLNALRSKAWTLAEALRR